MLKKSLFVLSFATLSSTTFAAPVANLIVNGSITPPTCTVNGQDEVDVTYEFDIAPGLFPASGNLTLTEQVKPIEVVCDATTYLSFTTADNRAGTASTSAITNFGLGTYGEDNTKVGFYTISTRNATVKADADATATNVGFLNGTTYATTAAIDTAKTTAWATSTTALSSGKVFAANIAVRPTINSVMKNTAGDAKLDGHAVLTFAFGL